MQKTNITGVCGEHSQCPAKLGLPPLTGVCFPRLHCSGFRLLYMERALRCVQFQFLGTPQSADLVGPAYCAFPGLSSSGRQELDGRAHSPRVLCTLSSLRPQTQFLRAGVPVVCALCFFWGAGF